MNTSQPSTKDQLEQLVARNYSNGIFYSEFVLEAKRRYIVHVLRACNGNQCRAAPRASWSCTVTRSAVLSPNSSLTPTSGTRAASSPGALSRGALPVLPRRSSGRKSALGYKVERDAPDR